MRASGKVNLVGLVIVGAIGAGIYWLALVGPLYIDNLDVKEAVAATFNHKGTWNRDLLRANLVDGLNSLKFGTHDEYDRYTGETKTLPGLRVADEDILVEDDIVRKILLIRVKYYRKVVLWPSKKERNVPFVVERKGAY